MFSSFPDEAFPYSDDYGLYDEWGHTPSRPLDRLTHLVLVDGRLVDVWSESVTGTRWERFARDFDRDRRLKIEPPVPVHQRVLEWLDAMVGGRDALMSLDDARADAWFEPDPDLPRSQRELLASVVELIDVAARALHDGESSAVLHAALRELWEVDPEAVLRAGAPARIVGGLCWLVGKANGLFGVGGTITQTHVKDVIGCPTTLSIAGQALRPALAGFWPDPGRPCSSLPDLLPLGRRSLLTSATRRRLIRFREQALAAQRAVAIESAAATPP
jgi:hypothetical protein